MNLSPTIDINWVPGLTLEEMEKQTILKAFQFYRNNKTQTSMSLGISIRTLDSKLEKYSADAKHGEAARIAEDERRAEILNRMRGIQPVKKNEASEVSAKANVGLHLEPAINPASQYEMPMQKSKEVQGVLPRQAAPNSKHRGR